MAEEELNDMEMVSFGIVASAGSARSLAFESLKTAKTGDFEKADELMEQAEAAALGAHDSQTAILSKFCAGEEVPVDVLLVHAQDHLMTSMLARELIAEINLLYKEIDALKAQVAELGGTAGE